MFFDARIAAHLSDSNAKDLDIAGIARRFSAKTPGEGSSALIRALPALRTTLESIAAQRPLQDIELPLIPVLCRMERAGIKVDPAILGELGQRMRADLLQAEKDIYRIAGEEFNIASPKQLQTILFDKLALPVIKRTKTGPSTDADVLQELSAQHELPARILQYRELSKLLSTYVEALPVTIHPATGRVHSTFSQIGAATGRLSSRDPNLQNIPIRTELSRAIRGAFVAEAGHVLLSADYSQIELRLFAHCSADRNMIQSFTTGTDIHAATAAKVFSIPLEAVNGERRRYAKTINFGLMYGMGAFRLSRELGITMESAKEFIEQYFAAYPGIRIYMQRVLDDCRRDGYVTTLFGRRRPIPGINSSDRALSEAAKREAVNSVIQGTAADIIKLAMVRLDERLQQECPASRIILQIHDEILFEVPRRDADRVATIAREIMPSVCSLSVPLSVEVGQGESWLEAH